MLRYDEINQQLSTPAVVDALCADCVCSSRKKWFKAYKLLVFSVPATAGDTPNVGLSQSWMHWVRRLGVPLTISSHA